MISFVYIDDDELFEGLVKRAVASLETRLEGEPSPSYRFVTVGGAKCDDECLFLDEQGRVIESPRAEGSPVREVMRSNLLRASLIREYAAKHDSFFLLDVDFRHPSLRRYGISVAHYLRNMGVPSERILLFTQYPDEANALERTSADVPWADFYDKGQFDTLSDRAVARLADRLRGVVEGARAAEQRQLDFQRAPGSKEVENQYAQLHQVFPLPTNITGASLAWLRVMQTASKIAASDVSVLILGASGTGKEVLANAIHVNSRRASKPFVSVNCAGFSETLLESELFGHVKGAFTGAVSDRKGLFQVADGGTLFLDEVGNMSSSMQTKLLRVLDKGEVSPVGSDKVVLVDVRIISATDADLQELATRTRTFNEALYTHQESDFGGLFKILLDRSRSIW